MVKGLRLSAIQKEDLSKNIPLQSRSASLDWPNVMDLIPTDTSEKMCASSLFRLFKQVMLLILFHKRRIVIEKEEVVRTVDR